jgi:hypothetical protein
VKLIIVGRKHAFAVELQFPLSVARVQVTDSGDDCDETYKSDAEDLNRPDYSGTVQAHLERRTDMEDAYGKVKDQMLTDIRALRQHPFGFGNGSGK